MLGFRFWDADGGSRHRATSHGRRRETRHGTWRPGRRRLQRRRRRVLDRAPARPGQPVRVRPARLGPDASTRPRVLDEWIDLTFPGAPRPPSRQAAARRCWTARGARTSRTPRRSASASWCARATTTAPTSTATSTPRGAPTTSPTATASASTARGPTGTGLHRPVPGAVVGRLRVAATVPRRAAAVLPPRAVRRTCCTAASTVIQHIYDTHFDGVEPGRGDDRRVVRGRRSSWTRASPRGSAERLDEQLRSATEWRDQVNTYFLRKSGIPDKMGRTIY